MPYILFAIGFALATFCLAQAGNASPPQLRPANDCFYAGAITVISRSPRIVTPRFYTVDPLSLDDMRRATRKSIMLSRYDDIYRTTDIASRHIRYAFVFALPCNRFLHYRAAKN